MVGALANKGVLGEGGTARQASAGVPVTARQVAQRLAVGGGGQAVAARAAVAGDGAVDGEEALRVAGRREPPHASLALACGLMRVLGAVVEPLVSAVLDAGEGRPLGGTIARERVGADDTRDRGQPLEQRTKALPRGCGIATGLHQDSAHGPVLIDGPPGGVLRPVAAAEDRVERPRSARARATVAQGVGVGLTARAAPLADRLVAHEHPALGQEFRHVAVAAREAAVQPDRVRDERGRAPLTGVGGGRDRFFHVPSSACSRPAPAS